MYCINCGVKLADTEKKCPLCGTRVYHPDITQGEIEGFYPKSKYPAPEEHPLGFPIFATAVFILPFLMVLFCDLRFNQAITWSGFVMGALILVYLMLILPLWFKSPNPMIFVPCWFGAMGVYLLYINWATAGNWFMSFALPILGCVTAIVTAVIGLLRYVRRGKLYIFGGAFIVIGFMMILLEYLLDITFLGVEFIGWSFYPLLSLGLIGGLLIFLGICRPAREVVERKLFI